MAYYKLVELDDLGRTFTATAQTVVSGGDLVMFASGAQSFNVGSTMNFDAASRIQVVKASGTAATFHSTVVGVALTNAGSNTPVEVAMQGTFILPAGSNGVGGGRQVGFVGYSNMVENVPAGSSNCVVGRALSAAADQTGLVIVRLSV